MLLQKVSAHLGKCIPSRPRWAINFSLSLTLSQMKTLDSPNLKHFPDDNSKFHENGEKFSKGTENAVGKGEIPCYKQFLLFPQSFQKTCSADT